MKRILKRLRNDIKHVRDKHQVSDRKRGENITGYCWVLGTGVDVAE